MRTEPEELVTTESRTSYAQLVGQERHRKRNKMARDRQRGGLNQKLNKQVTEKTNRVMQPTQRQSTGKSTGGGGVPSTWQPIERLTSWGMVPISDTCFIDFRKHTLLRVSAISTTPTIIHFPFLAQSGVSLSLTTNQAFLGYTY